MMEILKALRSFASGGHTGLCFKAEAESSGSDVGVNKSKSF